MSAIASPNNSERSYRLAAHAMLAMLSILVVVPVAWVVMAAFKTKSEFFSNPWNLPQGLHWQNFIDAFVTAQMGVYFADSLFVTGLGLVFSLLVAVPASYALARVPFTGRRFVEGFLMAGLFINVNYIVVPIFLLLLGWDNALREWLPNGFFIDNLAVLSVVYAATSLPFTIYLLTAFFRTIPTVYEEAAALDGASRLRTMVSIMVPMARPAISTVVLFNFLSFWNDFIISLTLIPGEKKTLQVGLLNLFQAQRAAADYGRLYAGMVIVMVPVLVLYAMIQKKLVTGMGGGGIK